jgi:hypothetical protein
LGLLIRAKMRWQNNGSNLPVVGTFERYAVSTLGLVRLRMRLGVMRLLVRLGVLRLLVRFGVMRLLVGSGVLRRLSVASLLVDADLFTVLMRVLCGLLGRLLVLLLLLLLRGLGTTQALFFVDADLFCDVDVVLLGRRSVDGGGEGFVGFFVTFPSV